MLRRKPGLLLTALIAFLRAAGYAQEPGNEAIPPMRVSSTNEFVPNLEPITRVYARVGTNEFAILVPPGYRMSDSDGLKVTFVNADYNCYLTFQVCRRALPEVKELNPDDYRGAALGEHPGASLAQEFTVGALSTVGPAFDIKWTGAGGVGRMERVAYIRSENWIVKFTMLANADVFGGGQAAFNSLLLNFRASQGGKLVLNKISDRI
jgi:hypothetical protein